MYRKKACPYCGTQHKNKIYCSSVCAGLATNPYSRLLTDDELILLQEKNRKNKEQQISKRSIARKSEKRKRKILQRIQETSTEKLSNEARRKKVIIEQEYKCATCGYTHWNNIPIIFELNHIDGNHQNNKRENLEALCPNCHSLTPTWRGRNARKNPAVSDEELIAAIKSTPSIRQALLLVGMAAKGGNYRRAYKLEQIIIGGLSEIRTHDEVSLSD